MLKRISFLSGNMLKMLALVLMTVDHVGYMLFPQYRILRIIGRLAMPIFAFMIAEGCRHTKNRRRYLLTMLAFSLVCQLVYFFVLDSLYQCIFVTFSFSIALIILLQRWQEQRTALEALLFAGAVFAVIAFCYFMPRWLSHTDFDLDYGVFGVFLPVLIYCGQKQAYRLALAAVGMFFLAQHSGGIQWYSLLCLPLLALYNGERGKWRMKYFFYLYYPCHLVAIYGISLLMNRL